MSTMQDQFEAWHTTLYGKPFRLGQTDQYKMDSTQGKWQAWQAAFKVAAASIAVVESCTCPSGDGSLRWPCAKHPPLPVAITDKTGPNGIKWYVEPNLPDGVNLYIKDSK